MNITNETKRTKRSGLVSLNIALPVDLHSKAKSFAASLHLSLKAFVIHQLSLALSNHKPQPQPQPQPPPPKPYPHDRPIIINSDAYTS